jgi:hypothetical protein
MREGLPAARWRTESLRRKGALTRGFCNVLYGNGEVGVAAAGFR